ncbi:sugar ABC transporter ATP-binding protein [Capillimicrobium parvum]|uniref:Ribose import ATP-binding protein RbsA n=1 Tax=Capillimicrobium parvum TaxID=2884022 RepID=A0A9E6XWI0_9ACTN|nr:sugar ABC transporter ATP-binding protein [Capillimicrobium parvum]UGS35735.1 Ribose import ATP-binding protein RbsA [Capillimicrobium parvum]
MSGAPAPDVSAGGESRPQDTPILQADGIVKSFGRSRVLEHVSLVVRAGSVHGLVGENGAGKSTLGKILSGVLRPDEGTMRVGGTPVAFSSPADALRAGVTIMQQELSLAPDLTVRENVLLGQQPSRFGVVSRRLLRRQFSELLDRTGFEIDGGARVGALPIAKQQEVEILRALARGARVIIMDEPTSALSAQDGERLHAVVGSLRDSGIAVIYVSHFLEEVLALSDEVTIMRNGQRVRTVAAQEATIDTLVTHMLGGAHDANFPPLPPVAPEAKPVLEVRGLRRRGQEAGVDLTVRAGEVLGLFGLVGAGRSELAHAMFGALGGVTGEVLVDGRPVDLSRPVTAMASGIALLPESRKDQGLFLGMSQHRNATMASLDDFSRAGFIRGDVERRAARDELEAMGVNPVALTSPVGVLSGGNQQKVLFAKTLLRRPRVLILDEPTRGVDIGARRAIYDIVVSLLAGGMAIVLISSEYDKVAQMSHRLSVLREGRIVESFDAGEVSHDAALAAAFGVSTQSNFIKEVT